MTLLYDLHSHSTASDGTMSPAGLVEHAARQGVDVLALTDHDTTDGVEEASAAARRLGLRLVPGVEISVTWNRRTIHVVGLGIDPDCGALRDGLAGLRRYRRWRAEEIGRRLERAGVKGALAGARRFAGGSSIGRIHFARYLVEQGHAQEMGQVFKRFLVKGKPGYVAGEWATLGQATEWICAAGGMAVIAHPARYRLSATQLRRLIGEFRENGGVGIEVVSSSHSRDDCFAMALHARRAGLLASCGSDYHGPDNPRAELGRIPALPNGCLPVWESPRWRLYEAPQEGYPLQSRSERWPRG